jgi:hypothetical protein
MIPTLLISLSLSWFSSLGDLAPPQTTPLEKADQDSAEKAPGKSKTDPGYWAGSDMKAAHAEARHRGVPFLLLIVRDGDPVCESWANQHLNDQAFRAVLAKHGVPAIACVPAKNGEVHQPTPETSDSCPLSGCLDCREHLGSESLLEGLPIPDLLPRLYLINPASEEARAFPEDLPFRGSEAIEKYLAERSEASPPTRTQYRFLLTHLERAREYDSYEEFEKGCQELAAAKRLLAFFGPELTDLWDQAYAPYRGRGIQMIRKAKNALKTNRVVGARMLTRVAKMMADLPEGERARHLLKALKPVSSKPEPEKEQAKDQNIPN